MQAAAYIEMRSPWGQQGEDAAFWTFADGKLLEREHVKAAVQAMVLHAGLPARRGNTHSLRIGGATALYSAVRDMEVVKRWGRWSGDVAHLYVWDERSALGQDAKAMEKAGSEVVAFMAERR